MDDIDTYDELRSLMRDLEARGVAVGEIIDCSFRLALGAASRLYGPQAAASSLIDMAVQVGGTPTRPPAAGYRLH
jgi:hypothetical protein